MVCSVRMIIQGIRLSRVLARMPCILFAFSSLESREDSISRLIRGSGLRRMGIVRLGIGGFPPPFFFFGLVVR